MKKNEINSMENVPLDLEAGVPEVSNNQNQSFKINNVDNEALPGGIISVISSAVTTGLGVGVSKASEPSVREGFLTLTGCFAAFSLLSIAYAARQIQGLRVSKNQQKLLDSGETEKVFDDYKNLPDTAKDEFIAKNKKLLHTGLKPQKLRVIFDQYPSSESKFGRTEYLAHTLWNKGDVERQFNKTNVTQTKDTNKTQPQMNMC